MLERVEKIRSDFANNIMLIVGLGGIGKWHARSFTDAGVSVAYIDPYQLDANLQRLEKVSDYKGNDIIVATTSTVRHPYVVEIEENLLNCNVLLEKPLFSNSCEFDDFSDRRLKNNYFINLPCEPVFKDLIKTYGLSVPETLTIEGVNWGMACNFLHDASLLGGFFNQSLTVSDVNSVNISEIESKRNGFKEIVGNMSFTIQGTRCNFVCTHSPELTPSKKITMVGSDYEFTWVPFEGVAVLKTREVIKKLPFVLPSASTSSHDLFVRAALPKAIKYTSLNKQVFDLFSAHLGLGSDYPYT